MIPRGVTHFPFLESQYTSEQPQTSLNYTEQGTKKKKLKKNLNQPLHRRETMNEANSVNLDSPLYENALST